MMGTSTGFHNYRATLKVGKKLYQLLAIALPAQQRPALPILTMQVEGMLTEVNADEAHSVHDDLHPKRAPYYGVQCSVEGDHPIMSKYSQIQIYGHPPICNPGLLT